eukprot:GFKZ01009344.1.p2 GENE.GFKZ01009344.1~~GFKZ01009344.1.p2  ORF type:complete len:116 (-),score=4.46 GFKZ01009344.1:963-1310(-)
MLQLRFSVLTFRCHRVQGEAGNCIHYTASVVLLRATLASVFGNVVLLQATLLHYCLSSIASSLLKLLSESLMYLTTVQYFTVILPTVGAVNGFLSPSIQQAARHCSAKQPKLLAV